MTCGNVLFEEGVQAVYPLPTWPVQRDQPVRAWLGDHDQQADLRSIALRNLSSHLGVWDACVALETSEATEGRKGGAGHQDLRAEWNLSENYERLTSLVGLPYCDVSGVDLD